MPTKGHFISSPAQLQRLATEDPSIDHNVTITIFAPLAHEHVLADCRNPDSRYAKTPEGQRCGMTDFEYLDISSLAQAWRDNWKTVPTFITKVTFDLTLPEPDDGVERVRWEHGYRSGLKIHPPERETVSLVNTMVLGMNMRSQGRVKMEAVGKDAQGLGTIRSYIEALETQGRSSREKTLAERTRPEVR
ncbi:hypothetical protein PRZ48_001122 [Zasmidium cellare]|uniref:Uncharacterized protein n=1 Tax=Zasmidium cellare TaxID=395010 RepID=A0ABR0F0E8_ZASCE|nr:hypothetical protein PRZ48_001122 [Zasmidium cellare]